MSVFETFLNYTEEMYAGNEPCGREPNHLEGGFYDSWTTQYGSGRSYNGKIVYAAFCVNRRVTVYIIGSALWIVDQRHSGKSDVWEYSNEPDKFHTTNVSPLRVHVLELERIEKILNTKIDSVFWRMVQSRAREIYDGV